MNNYKTIQSNIDACWKISILSLFALLVVLMPDASFAFGDFDTNLCKALKALTGTPAKVIATFGIVFLGIGAFFGKLNWGTALLFGVGIIAIFAAGSIVDFLGGAGSKC